MMVAKRSRGFTLPELMIAGATGSFLMLVFWELMLLGSELESENEARARMNNQARQAMTLLIDGGIAANGEIGIDGSGLVPGIRAAGQIPAGAHRIDGRLRLGGNGLELVSDEGPESTIVCTAPLVPLPECLLPGQQIVLKGWYSRDPGYQQVLRSVNNRTTEIEFEISDARQRARKHNRSGSETEDYWTITTRISEGLN